MTNADRPLLRIGTRGSKLALVQAHAARAALMAAHPDLADERAVAITIIRTTGDTVQDRTLSSIGGKGLFTKEIEQALLDGTIDLAVHSMKDVPTVLPDGLVIDCHPPREDPRDAFFSTDGATLAELPAGAVVGTASLRRGAQIRHARPDLRIVPYRGNVETRLAKLERGVVDATLLAAAGLNRLGFNDQKRELLDPSVMLPAVAQGVIGIERRQSDDRVAAYLAPLNDPETALLVSAERALLAILDGSCRTPIGALAERSGEAVRLRGLVIRPDGSERHAIELSAPSADAEALGLEAGRILRERTGGDFFVSAEPDGDVR